MKKKLSILSFLVMGLLLTACGPTNGSDNSSVEDSSGFIAGGGNPNSFNGGTVTLYAINDFHGAVKKQGTNMGLLDIGTYFKQKGVEPNTLLVNSGDAFQGSIESNWNRGTFLTDAMDIIKFDAFTLGNHEFDWGLDNLHTLLNRKSFDYKTPWLSSNIYEWDHVRKAAGSKKITDLGSEYAVQTLENGLKVGFIGAIGSSQWTSITSNVVGDLTFVDPVPVVKNISDKLRTEEKCDLVFLTYHGTQEELLGQGLTSVSNVSNKKYVDSVFCAHSHAREDTTENGVIFTQNNAYGANASKVTLTISKNKTVSKATLDILEWSDIVDSINGNYDAELKSLYDKNTAITDPIGDEVLATTSGVLSNNIANVTADALLEEGIKQGHNPVLAMTNLRQSMKTTTITYSALLASLPFENVAVVMKATGQDIKNEASYSGQYIARNPAFTGSLNDSEMYEIICIDYLAYHMNTRHEYNYFPSIQVLGELTAEDGGYLGYRDITANYLKEKKTLNANDYNYRYNSKFSKSGL